MKQQKACVGGIRNIICVTSATGEHADGLRDCSTIMFALAETWEQRANCSPVEGLGCLDASAP